MLYMHGMGYDDMLLAMELGKEEAANGTEIEKAWDCAFEFYGRLRG